jgi:hypothetical protein
VAACQPTFIAPRQWVPQVSILRPGIARSSGVAPVSRPVLANSPQIWAPHPKRVRRGPHGQVLVRGVAERLGWDTTNLTLPAVILSEVRRAIVPACAPHEVEGPVVAFRQTSEGVQICRDYA